MWRMLAVKIGKAGEYWVHGSRGTSEEEQKCDQGAINVEYTGID